MRGHTKLYERVPKYTTVSFGMRKIYPRMKSDSEANPISRPARGDVVNRSPSDKNGVFSVRSLNAYLLFRTHCGLVAPHFVRVEPSKALRCLTAGAGNCIRT